MIGEITMSRGLGDDIKKITSATRLDRLSERIAEILGQTDCGCDERQEWLNDKTKNWPIYKKRNMNGNDKEK
jgi:hypothetical protein